MRANDIEPLLYDLYSIHAMTGREWPMVAFVQNRHGYAQPWRGCRKGQ